MCFVWGEFDIGAETSVFKNVVVSWCCMLKCGMFGGEFKDALAHRDG